MCSKVTDHAYKNKFLFHGINLSNIAMYDNEIRLKIQNIEMAILNINYDKIKLTI